MVLLLLLFLPTALSSDSTSRKNFTIKHIESCPEEGYFVQRELAPNSLGPGPCYLCFCQRDSTATCWRREDWRCDVEKYHHHHVGKREARMRRAAGLADIFFRDAARDVFNKNIPEQCKPFESSFSDGCPPVDWCIGCTVCDCDANGHWDCHVLSFCDKSTKKPQKKRKANYRRTVIRKATLKPKATANNKVAAKPQPKVIKKVIKNPANLNTRTKRQPQKQKNIHKNSKSINRNKPQKIIKKKVPARKIIKKEVKKQADVRDPNQIVLPTTPKFAQAVVKKVLAAVQQLMRNDVRKGNSSKILNAVEKNRPKMRKEDKNALMKRFSNIIRQGAKQINGNTNNFNGKKTARNKRDISGHEGLEVISVAPMNKVEITSSENIIPVHEIETTTENSTFITNLNTLNETLSVTLNSTTPLMSDSLLYNVTIASQTNYTTKENTMLELTTASYNISELNVTPSVTTSTTTEYNIRVENITKDVQDIKNDTKETMKYITTNIVEGNDLKFNKWPEIKMLMEREKYLRKELDNLNDRKNTSQQSNFSIIDLKPNISTQNITRKINIPRRNTLRRIILGPRLQKDNANIGILNKKVSNLQNIFRNIVKEFNKNTTKAKSSSRKINIVKYMRNLFSKLIRAGKSKTSRTETELLLDKEHTINMICENIGYCKVNAKDRSLLDAKLSQLSIETNKILKIIKVIKGLLHLVEFPMGGKVKNEILKPTSNSNDDIDKLKILLRDSYFSDLKLKSLTETQATQIDYIKKNTQEFIRAIAKFAKLLNEIVAILKNSNKPTKKRKIRNLEDSKIKSSEAFRRLRSLLIRYDMMQNSFFKKIYKSLSAFELNLNKEKQKRNSLDTELKNTAAIDNFSRNIVTNLRKLTQLAQSMNSRSKRETMKDNDTVEYLLMLMEYLLKHNHSLDAAPANDGIDLLIEAIKNAPNMKPVKKKVLQYIPAVFPTRTSPAKVKQSKAKNLLRTTTIKKDVHATSRLDDPKFDELVEEDRDYDDKYLNTRRAIDNKAEEEFFHKVTTVPPKIHSLENMKDSNSEGLSEGKVEKIGYSDDTVGKMESADSKIDKHNTRESVEDKRYDIFNADLRDVTMSITTDGVLTPSTEIIDAETTTEPITTANYNEKTEKFNKRIEWIDKNYDKDVKHVKEIKETNQESTEPTPTATRTKKGTKADENVSAITKEVTSEIKKKLTTKGKTTSEEVVYRKQMDLLNSLDYVTDKAEFDIESKEGEEPYLAYFV